MLRDVVPPAPSGDLKDLSAWRLLVQVGRCVLVGDVGVLADGASGLI